MKLFNLLVVLVFAILIVDISSKKKVKSKAHSKSSKRDDSKHEVFKLKFLRTCLISNLDDLNKKEKKPNSGITEVVQELEKMRSDETQYEKSLSHTEEGSVSKMMITQSTAAVSIIANKLDVSLKKHKELSKKAQAIVEDCNEKMINLPKKPENKNKRKHR